MEPELKVKAEQAYSQFKNDGRELTALGLPRSVEDFHTFLMQRKDQKAKVAATLLYGLFLVYAKESNQAVKSKLLEVLTTVIDGFEADSEVNNAIELYDLRQWLAFLKD